MKFQILTIESSHFLSDSVSSVWLFTIWSLLAFWCPFSPMPSSSNSILHQPRLLVSQQSASFPMNSFSYFPDYLLASLFIFMTQFSCHRLSIPFLDLVPISHPCTQTKVSFRKAFAKRHHCCVCQLWECLSLALSSFMARKACLPQCYNRLSYFMYIVPIYVC